MVLKVRGAPCYMEQESRHLAGSRIMHDWLLPEVTNTDTLALHAGVGVREAARAEGEGG